MAIVKTAPLPVFHHICKEKKRDVTYLGEKPSTEAWRVTGWRGVILDAINYCPWCGDKLPVPPIEQPVVYDTPEPEETE
mgnify:CR=1 FL=1